MLVAGKQGEGFSLLQEDSPEIFDALGLNSIMPPGPHRALEVLLGKLVRKIAEGGFFGGRSTKGLEFGGRYGGGIRLIKVRPFGGGMGMRFGARRCPTDFIRKF